MTTQPSLRLRRLRKTPAMRDLLQEHTVRPEDLILPIFVEEGLKERTEIRSLPGVFRETEESLGNIVQECWEHGLKAVMIFGVSHNKDHNGSDSLKNDGLLARMIKKAKDACPEILVIADLCFCEYTDHGHCGPLNNKGDVDNDATLKNLSKQAVIAASAGADIVAPSGMMDGMVAAIREGLDSEGFNDVPILSYAAKFASEFYGPFRDAAGCSLEGASGNALKDRKTYQMNPANALESLREVHIDVEEGADMVMIKPGLPYLDIIAQVKECYGLPTFAYHVSGEYAMLKLAAEKGLMDFDLAYNECLLSFKRAGCDGIFTYGALNFAKRYTTNK